MQNDKTQDKVMTEKSLTNNELYEKLEALFSKKTDEIKSEIKTINSTVLQLENKQNAIEKRVIDLERRHRKNNIIIFGLEENATDLQNHVIGTLNNLLQIDLKDTDVNNIYQIGKKNTVIVEFISYLRKQLIFANIKKLKGKKITITNDLCPEDRENNKILYENLKEARQKNLTAYIKKNKLYVNNEAFTADQLKKAEEIVNTPTLPEEEIVSIEAKPNSAPPTPTTIYGDANFLLNAPVSISKSLGIENSQENIVAGASSPRAHPSTSHPPRDGLLKISKDRKNSSSSEGRSLRNKKN